MPCSWPPPIGFLVIGTRLLLRAGAEEQQDASEPSYGGWGSGLRTTPGSTATGVTSPAIGRMKGLMRIPEALAVSELLQPTRSTSQQH